MRSVVLSVCAHKVHCCWHFHWPHLHCWNAGNLRWCSSGCSVHKAAARILGCQCVEEVRNPEHSTWTFCGSTETNPDPGPASVCTLPQSPQMLRLDPSQTLEYLLSCWQSSQRQQQERGGYGGSSPFLACALIVGFQWQYMSTVLWACQKWGCYGGPWPSILAYLSEDILLLWWGHASSMYSSPPRPIQPLVDHTTLKPLQAVSVQPTPILWSPGFSTQTLHVPAGAYMGWGSQWGSMDPLWPLPPHLVFSYNWVTSVVHCWVSAPIMATLDTVPCCDVE